VVKKHRHLHNNRLPELGVCDRRRVKKGLLVHRPHHYYNGEQCKSGNQWQVSTKEGVKVCDCDSLRDAKQRAVQFGRCMDVQKANCFKLTPEQEEAVERVGRAWRNAN